MNKNIIGMGLLLGLGVLAGCAAETGDDGDSGKAAALAASTCGVEEGAVGARDVKFNGPTLNGRAFNGLTLNGMRANGLTLNGLTLNGIDLNGIDLNGTTLNGLTLNGPVLQGTTLNGWTLNGLTLNGLTFNGPVLQGTELTGQMSDGSTIAVFIDEVRANPDADNADVVLYAVSVGERRMPLCGRNDDGTVRMATAIANTWDEKTGARIDSPDRFTFACEGGALYKCVAAGYKPWKSAELAEYHQACTRMVRADYCGDGQSYTKDGTVIDMGDALGVQSFETESRADFALEATWGPNGATCVSKTRYRLPSVPSCLADRLKDACDTSAPPQGGVTLANRSASQTTCIE